MTPSSLRCALTATFDCTSLDGIHNKIAKTKTRNHRIITGIPRFRNFADVVPSKLSLNSVVTTVICSK